MQEMQKCVFVSREIKFSALLLEPLLSQIVAGEEA